MTEAPNAPYRSMIYLDREAAIHAQMIGAIALLRQWRWWGPVIAGGALWSWAAGNPANDVDIFAKRTWLSERLAYRAYGPSSLDRDTISPGLYAGYGGWVDGRGFYVYSTHLRNHPSTDVDFVLSSPPRYKDRPRLAANLFDYAHCEVAFGLNWETIDGADEYCNGVLHELIPRPRDKKFVLGKVQSSLWGKPEARNKLIGVMNKLATLQGRKVLPFLEKPEVPRLTEGRFLNF